MKPTFTPTYRAMTESDLPFVLNSWQKMARRQGDRAYMTARVYAYESQVIMQLIRAAKVVMICNPEDKDHILGWVCLKKAGPLLIIHYAYMRQSFQKQGIMKALLKEIDPRFGIDQTVVTRLSDLIARKRDKYRLVFNPHIEEIINGHANRATSAPANA
jgi:hypothetical protein